MNRIPNILTTTRIILSLFFTIFLFKYFSIKNECNYYSIIITFIAICTTDILDGYIARLLNIETKAGAIFDVVADLIFVVSATITLNILGLLPIWYTALVMGKFIEFALTSKILKSHQKSVFFFDVIGKTASIIFWIIPFSACIVFRYFANNFTKIIYLQLGLVACLVVISSLYRIIRCYKVLNHGSAPNNRCLGPRL